MCSPAEALSDFSMWVRLSHHWPNEWDQQNTPFICLRWASLMPAAQGSEKAQEASALRLCCGALETMKCSQAAMSECSGKEAAERKWRRLHSCGRWERTRTAHIYWVPVIRRVPHTCHLTPLDRWNKPKGIVMTSLWVSKMRFRDVKSVAQGHTAGK